MSTHNIGFYKYLTKIIFELSSNMHLISSADFYHDKAYCILCFCGKIVFDIICIYFVLLFNIIFIL